MQIILASAKIMHDRFLDKPSDRAERFDEKPKLPAILAYHGQAYKHLKAETLNVDDFNYSQGKLWITSFLYGLLRPLDGILPYRMEGHVELPSGGGKNMFGFWNVRFLEEQSDRCPD